MTAIDFQELMENHYGCSPAEIKAALDEVLPMQNKIQFPDGPVDRSSALRKSNAQEMGRSLNYDANECE